MRPIVLWQQCNAGDCGGVNNLLIDDTDKQRLAIIVMAARVFNSQCLAQWMCQPSGALLCGVLFGVQRSTAGAPDFVRVSFHLHCLIFFILIPEGFVKRKRSSLAD